MKPITRHIRQSKVPHKHPNERDVILSHEEVSKAAISLLVSAVNTLHDVKDYHGWGNEDSTIPSKITRITWKYNKLIRDFQRTFKETKEGPKP